MKAFFAFLAALYFLFPLGAWEQKWSAAELMKWKSTGEPVRLEHSLRIGKGQFQLMKLTLLLAEKAPVAPVNLTVIFRGGDEPGNHYWNHVVRQNIDHGGSLYECYLTVPRDSNNIELKLQPGTAKVREITLGDVTANDLKDRVVRLAVDPGKTLSKPTAFHFGANFDSANFPGVYYGSLPASAPGSKRAEFIDFLKKSNLRSARYPGGTASHWLLPESREASQKLMKLSRKRDTPKLTGWREFRDTMKEAGVKIIYQLNTSFFLDENGEIRAIDATRFPKEAKLDVSRGRYAEAAAALERNFQTGVFKPGDVDYWELGNEDYAYMSTEQYVKVCRAFIPVIAKHDPGRAICVSGMKGLEEELKKYPEIWEKITGVAVHYPYGSWPRPTPTHMTADYCSFANADVNFPKNLAGRASAKKITVSETSVYNLFTYDSFRMQPSFAMGLAIAGNWPKLLNRPEVDMAVFHDFESIYFGLAFFDVSFSETGRVYKWLDGQPAPPLRTSGPAWYVDPSPANSNKYFPMQYVDSPGLRTLGMLSAFSGGELYTVKAESEFGSAAGYLAGTDATGKPAVFASNPLEVPVLLRLDYPGFPAKCRMRRLNADSFGAALAGEYRDNDREIVLSGGMLILPARSITLLTVP